MANYLSDRTGASIDTVLDDADAGNTGKVAPTEFSGDLNSININGFTNVKSTSANIPKAEAGMLITSAINSVNTGQIFQERRFGDLYCRSNYTGAWQTWNELYHTGNTGFITFGNVAPTAEATQFKTTSATIQNFRAGVSQAFHLELYNDNGAVGSISTTGSATSFNTSSDPRLKDFAEAPTDSAINAEFNSLFSCFRIFNWKSDPQGDLVWGFDAWKAIDSGLGFGSEGEGPRELPLGAVYETIPAVTETRVVLDAEGAPTTQTEEVVITEAIEKRTSPAGVDQSKITALLLAKIEQLERRLSLLGG